MWPFGRKGRRRPETADPAGLGARGETLARQFLKRQGMRILARNYRCPVGEADLVALDRATRRDLGSETLVFVEVKTRRAGQLTDPHSAVNAEKRRRMQKVAAYYLNAHDAEDLPARFDVISIVVDDRGKPQIQHIPDAFQ